MKKRLLSSFLHILLFVLIETAFVVIILHEFPSVSFFEDLGIIHLLYWIALFIAWFVRESLKNFQVKFLATYLPIVLHVVGHFYIWHETLSLVHSEEHSGIWLLISTVVLGILIFLWEYLLHNKYHCETHHERVHKHCHDDV